MTWYEFDGALNTVYTFADFAEAFAFMTRVGLIAQEQGHHPDMAISWNRVTITITTHDAGKTITDKDRKLAAAIDALGGA
ncbi:MAG: 4a-hydroxytetrahydrobiopterin dehydratase [Ilumatobacteraceae bacterium]|jgi:4a-hydroxytetrahydrobiopterin dehydratase